MLRPFGLSACPEKKMDCLNPRSRGLYENEAGTASPLSEGSHACSEEPRKEGRNRMLVDTQCSLISLDVWASLVGRKWNFSIKSAVIILFLFRIYPLSANLWLSRNFFFTWATDTNDKRCYVLGYGQIQQNIIKRVARLVICDKKLRAVFKGTTSVFKIMG